MQLATHQVRMFSQISAAATYNVRCARSMLGILNSLGQTLKSPSPNPILLFALAPSPTTPPEVLSDITSTLARLYPQHVGCISAPLPFQYFDQSIRSGPYSCSLASALVNGVSFRSTISGPAQAQVGRWHATRERTEDANEAMRFNTEDSQMRIISRLFESDGKVNWKDVWNRTANPVTYSSSHENGLDSGTLPNTLRNLDPAAIHNIVYFSDKAPERLAIMLESAFPQANKLSLIASSTPFITGHPVTLFHNGSILSNGAVGVALDTFPSAPPPVVELSFPPLLALSTNLKVTSSEGNLILSLDSENPTQLLLNATQKYVLASSHTTWVDKEDEFYVGVIDPLSQQLSQLHRITAGDPSRGTIALDAASAPKAGSIVRLYHLPQDPACGALRYPPDIMQSNSISLFVAPEMTPTTTFEIEIADGLTANDDQAVVPNAFLAASENGFTLSRSAQEAWKCVIPGGRAGLSWNHLRQIE